MAKIALLSGPALNWAVAMSDGRTIVSSLGGGVEVNGRHEDGTECPIEWRMTYMYSPSVDWSIAGPIIERESISLRHVPEYGYWLAMVSKLNTGQTERWVPNAAYGPQCWRGETALIAAMRCFVASVAEQRHVELPQEYRQ